MLVILLMPREGRSLLGIGPTAMEATQLGRAKRGSWTVTAKAAGGFCPRRRRPGAAISCRKSTARAWLWFDFDGDGLLDIYLLTHGGPNSRSINRLFKNMGKGVFKDVYGSGSGLGLAGYCTGVAIGDVNNDGHPDVVVTQYGGVKLFLNNGNGTFTDVTDEAGLKDPLWATSASFVDYDKDGWLDLVVVNYLDNDPSWPCRTATGLKEYCGPNAFPGTVTKLFHNLCRASKGPVHFEDVTVKAGLATAPGAGLGVYCADFNGDGWPDIFVSNDGQPNRLWINRHNGTFVDEAFAARAGRCGRHGAVASGHGRGSRRYRRGRSVRPVRRAPGHGTQHALDAGARARAVSRSHGGHGLAGIGLARHWFRHAHGRFRPRWLAGHCRGQRRVARRQFNADRQSRACAHLLPYGERNQLFRNEGQGKFRDVSPLNRAFCGEANVARGLAAGDLDGDGALDLVVNQVSGPARLFLRNVATARTTLADRARTRPPS